MKKLNKILNTIIIVSIIIITLYVKFPNSYSFFAPIIRIMRTMPFICISLFIIIIFSANIAPYIISFLLIIPLMTEGLKDGVDRLDKNLMDDLAMHEISFFEKLKNSDFMKKFPCIYCFTVIKFMVSNQTTLKGAEQDEKADYFHISCPCAIAISVPLSYFSGIGNASKNGILVKGSNYLDALRDIKFIACDKTGTLTKGKFEVEKIKIVINNKTINIIRKKDYDFIKKVNEKFIK